MKLEERTCACGCKKTFRCLPTSQTKYSSQHCMELSGVLPPPLEKKGYRPSQKAARPEASESKEEFEEAGEEDIDLESDETPLELDDADELIEEEDHPMERTNRNPPEIDPAT